MSSISIMRNGKTTKNFSEVRNATTLPSIHLGEKAHPQQGGGNSHHFPVIAEVSQGKKREPEVSPNLRKFSRCAKLFTIAGQRGGKTTDICLDAGQRCSQTRFPSLVGEPGCKSSNRSVKIAHTLAAPAISGPAAIHTKVSSSPNPGTTHQHVRKVPVKVEDKASEVWNEEICPSSSLYSTPEKSEVCYKGLEGLASASLRSTKLEASQRCRDLGCQKSLLTRRAVLHKAESRAACSSPPRPSQVPQLSQDRASLDCQADANTHRQGKGQVGKAGLKGPGDKGVPKRREGGHSVKLITLDVSSPLQSVSFMPRKSRIQKGRVIIGSRYAPPGSLSTTACIQQWRF
ncbi:uncharacterized protein LOC143497293 [Brachyhypopomus gauderio]|uniref:uncharacterized protein LOC143497293 n=1 Tax=Brachyhypopomus gauderio TaxID=698409 RepID=UPI0040423921